MEQLLKNLETDFCGEILRDEPLSAHTSWKLGGPAALYLIPEDRCSLQAALRLIHKRRIPLLVLGNGSNLLIADSGFNGVVLQLKKMNRIEFLPGGMVEVEAGAQLSQLIKVCCRQGLSGLAELSGIPGQVGGALLMNAGALQTEISALVSQVFLTDGLGEWALRRDQIEFGYRSSGLAGKGVISGAVLQLRHGDETQMQKQVVQVLARRSQVQNVSGAHAGSVFKNLPDQKAWQLIDQAGMRGTRCGAAEVSSIHCNHIVNLGGASSGDVLTLIREVRAAVKAKSGCDLELEVQLIGMEA